MVKVSSEYNSATIWPSLRVLLGVIAIWCLSPSVMKSTVNRFEMAQGT